MNTIYLVNVVEYVWDFFVSQLDPQFLNAELEIVERNVAALQTDC